MILSRTVGASVGSHDNKTAAYCVVQLPEKYKQNVNVSSEGPSSGRYSYAGKDYTLILMVSVPLTLLAYVGRCPQQHRYKEMFNKISAYILYCSAIYKFTYCLQRRFASRDY